MQRRQLVTTVSMLAAENSVSLPLAGFGLGDKRLYTKLLKNPNASDLYGHFGYVRDDAMSILIGLAARCRIEPSISSQIESLTDRTPQKIQNDR